MSFFDIDPDDFGFTHVPDADLRDALAAMAEHFQRQRGPAREMPEIKVTEYEVKPFRPVILPLWMPIEGLLDVYHGGALNVEKAARDIRERFTRYVPSKMTFVYNQREQGIHVDGSWIADACHRLPQVMINQVLKVRERNDEFFAPFMQDFREFGPGTDWVINEFVSPQLIERLNAQAAMYNHVRVLHQQLSFSEIMKHCWGIEQTIQPPAMSQDGFRQSVKVMQMKGRAGSIDPDVVRATQEKLTQIMQNRDLRRHRVMSGECAICGAPLSIGCSHIQGAPTPSAPALPPPTPKSLPGLNIANQHVADSVNSLAIPKPDLLSFDPPDKQTPP